MVAALFVIGGLAGLALSGVIYILFAALPKIGSGLKETGSGLQQLSERFQNFAEFMAQKLG